MTPMAAGSGVSGGMGAVGYKGLESRLVDEAIKNLFDDPSAPRRRRRRRRVADVASRGKRKTRRKGWQKGGEGGRRTK